MKGKRAQIWIGIVMIGLSACSASKPPAATAERTDWSAAALHTADQLANRLRAAGIKCEEFEPATFGGYKENTRLPLAAAVASCNSQADEDITFEVFESAADAQNFIRTKQALLCDRAARAKLLDFPGFAYVDGGAWLIEPDEKETADQIAPILGGQSKLAACSNLAPTP